MSKSLLLKAVRRMLTLTAAVLLTAFGTAASAQADIVSGSTAPSVRMLTYNACGAACDDRVSKDQWGETIKTSMDNWSADSVMLTEICYDQYEALRDKLTGYAPAWYATSNVKGCGEWDTDNPDLRIGLAIFVKTASVERLTFALPANPEDGNPRGLLCAKGAIEGRTTLSCVTHLSHVGDAGRLAQAKAVRAKVDEWAGNLPVILGGDFNAAATSAEMSEFYGFQGGTGRYGEVDESDQDYFTPNCTGIYCRSGETTHANGKLDYIFVSADHFRNVQGDALGKSANMSDHNLLRGAAEWE
ncbi:endonuclease/exonuclease/phosphatase family protein [Streptomyces sp. H27-S2]|uniref:endonuclease/exonuclease/phosphatase family protein n=1 Tax=Streptomyces antarcticus TaxID=2996458 RepID=UPI00226F1EA7|nr:endonuclease/exonuclease/phosphatase family protein [Streptomyces sp. H27-S2]MCY0951339.1 endonuclease/exonuclease/phosphatase family protein [Streptomyces sp. H27-S2]